MLLTKTFISPVPRGRGQGLSSKGAGRCWTPACIEGDGGRTSKGSITFSSILGTWGFPGGGGSPLQFVHLFGWFIINQFDWRCAAVQLSSPCLQTTAYPPAQSLPNFIGSNFQPLAVARQTALAELYVAVKYWRSLHRLHYLGTVAAAAWLKLAESEGAWTERGNFSLLLLSMAMQMMRGQNTAHAITIFT